MKMTFHERFGTLPVSTLRLIKKFNVSQSDFDLMTDLLGFAAWNVEKSEIEWKVINDHIVSNSETGMYIGHTF